MSTLIVIAKAPVPGRVKTRLTPPFTPEQGAELARKLGRLPKFTDWADARKADRSLLTEWQVYRMFDARKGAWSTFQYLVRERLRAGGATVERDGSIGG